MWFQPSDPYDPMRTGIEYRNFKEAKTEELKFYENIRKIADAANRKSTFATITSIISILISLATFILELIKYINL